MADEQNVPPNDTGGDAAHWQAEAKKAFQARQDAKKEADELKKRVAAFEGVDPEEYKTLKEQAQKAEEDRAKKAGEFEKVQQQLVQKHSAELKTEQEKRSAAESKLQRTLISREFASAVDLFGPSGKTIYLAADAERIFGDRVRLEDDGSVVVLDGAGQVILDGKTGKPAAFSAALSEYIDSLPDKQYRLRGSGKTGSGSSGGTTGGNAFAGVDFSNLTPQQRRDPKVIEQLKKMKPGGGMVFGRVYEQ